MPHRGVPCVLGNFHHVIALVEAELFVREQTYQAGADKANNEEARLEGLTDLCHALFNTNEFLHID